MKHSTTLSSAQILSGREALARRDSLEAAALRRLPFFLFWMAGLLPFILTYITGLASSATQGKRAKPTSESFNREARAFASTVSALILGAIGVLGGWPSVIAVIAGAALMLHGMRSFTSVVGHHMTHGAKVLPVSPLLRKIVYDVISAMLNLTSFDSYRKDHQLHHAYTAGTDDADQRFIAYLGVSFKGGWLRFIGTLMDPVFHYRFLKARTASVLFNGPMWRRVLAIATRAAIVLVAPWQALLAWFLVTVVIYQAATLMQWSTEHLWHRRPQGLSPAETATTVTFGRLLLADPESKYFWLILIGHAMFRAILLSGDLNNHDLHHLGRGPWVDAAYIRTGLILEGKIVLHQTGTIHDMFALALNSADSEVSPLAPRHMDPNHMLGM